MTKTGYRALLSVLFFLTVAASDSFANNIVVLEPSLVDQETTNNTYDIKFGVAWENSWYRDSYPPVVPARWDAAWVFVKYSRSSDGGTTWSPWAHCTLSDVGSVAPNNPDEGGQSQMDFGATDGAYKGVFIYRSAAGSGPVLWNGAEIRWLYGSDNVLDNDKVKIKVFAIEMVYVPEGAFYLGSGGTADVAEIGSFTEGSWVSGATIPFKVTSEGPITIAPGAGNLWGTYPPYPPYDPSSPNNPYNKPAMPRGAPIILPASFPKGYKGFYMMKYELSQGQYRDFLNTLTRNQQAARVATNIASGVMSVTNTYVMWNTPAVSYRNGIRCGTSIPQTDPVTFYCDVTSDGVTATNGEYLPSDLNNFADFLAFADWACLRPMTEFEFEKACRGPMNPVANEYAWGNITVEPTATSLTNVNTISEVPNQGNLSNNLNVNAAGPYRCGSFAAKTTFVNPRRISTGASYYGIMELSGNVCEFIVNAVYGGAFIGSHGDGVLTASGTKGHTNSDWPYLATGQNYLGTGEGNRGGSFTDSGILCRVSDRYSAQTATWSGTGTEGRYRNRGIRCVRTYP